MSALPTTSSPFAQINEKQIKTWIPPDKSFSIIYEMEYVEASKGVFPSTSGFLRLLSSLALNGGFPSNLGENWRTRTGCSPYIEYAMCLVLARAAGTFGACPALSFRSTEEKYCLCAAALELIKVAAGQYLAPLSFTNDKNKDFPDSFAAAKKETLQVLGLESLVECANLVPHEDDFGSFVNDMYPGYSTVGGPFTVSTERTQTFPQSASPPPKSVGFTVLTAALRTDGNSLFATLAAVLSDKGGQPISDPDDLALSLSLFRHLRPSFDNSKSGKPKDLSRLSNLLVTLRNEEDPSPPDSVVGLESVVANALQLLCIIASKEEAFASSVVAARLDKMVPMLHFNIRHSSPDVWNLHFLRTRDKLESFGLVAALPFFMSRLWENITVPSCAAALLFLSKDSSEISRHKEKVSLACAEMVSHLSAKSPSSTEFANLLSFFLGTLLKELENQRPTPLRDSLVCQPVLESLINASGSINFVLSKKSARVAARCFESIVLLNRLLGTTQYSAQLWHLSTSNIWNCVSRSASGEAPIDVLRSMTWVLKGLADVVNYSFSRPGAELLQGTGLADDTIRLLCEDGILVDLYTLLPSDTTGYSKDLSEALHFCLGSVLVVASRASRDIDLIAIIDVLLRQLGGDFDSDTLRYLSLALYISVDHAHMPPIPTAELASRLCDAVVRVPSSNEILVATLILALRRLGPNISDQERIEKMLQQVSKTLFHMCCEVTDNFPPAPTSQALTARAALKLLCSFAPDSAVHKVLVDSATFGRKRTPLDEMISLAARLDKDICSLLSLVGRVSLGSQELVRSGVLVALEQGGKSYREYEESIQNENPTLQSFPVPSFLCEHLQVCNVILSTVPEDLLHDAAQHVDEILKLYRPAIAQMLSTFPSDGNTTAEYLRTVSIVVRASRRFTPNPNPGVLSVRSPIPAFVFSLLENPLPRAFLGPIPKALMRKNTQAASDLVDMRAAEKSWWEDLKQQQPDMQINDLCALGKQAAEMILSGLYVVEHTTSISSLDPATLGRSLIAVVDSIVVRFVSDNRSMLSHVSHRLF